MPYNVNQAGEFDHDAYTGVDALGVGGDEFQQNAVDDFTAVVNTPGVTSGDIIAAAAKLKMALGASKAYFDVISTLGDDNKRLIEGAVR